MHGRATAPSGVAAHGMAAHARRNPEKPFAKSTATRVPTARPSAGPATSPLVSKRLTTPADVPQHITSVRVSPTEQQRKSPPLATLPLRGGFLPALRREGLTPTEKEDGRQSAPPCFPGPFSLGSRLQPQARAQTAEIAQRLRQSNSRGHLCSAGRPVSEFIVPDNELCVTQQRADICKYYTPPGARHPRRPAPRRAAKNPAWCTDDFGASGRPWSRTSDDIDDELVALDALTTTASAPRLPVPGGLTAGLGGLSTASAPRLPVVPGGLTAGLGGLSLPSTAVDLDSWCGAAPRSPPAPPAAAASGRAQSPPSRWPSECFNRPWSTPTQDSGDEKQIHVTIPSSRPRGRGSRRQKKKSPLSSSNHAGSNVLPASRRDGGAPM